MKESRNEEKRGVAVFRALLRFVVNEAKGGKLVTAPGFEPGTL